MTQAERLVRALRKGWHTYGDLEALRISTCPWRRISEAGHKYLRPHETVQRAVRDGLVCLRVARKV